jgi:nitroreductase
MEALEALLTRRTVPPVKMAEPGPNAEELARILEAGRAAPDHGRLTPWRFIVVEGEGRRKLGDLFAEALAGENPDWGEAEIDKQRTGPLRAPLILIVACPVKRDHPKIPPLEQIASAAAATQNMVLAAHAMGYAVKWATGKPAYSEGVRRGLGLEASDQIIAILYIGSYGADQPVPRRPGPHGIVAHWPEPGR